MIELRDLGPNDPCHCGSGKKLKRCHSKDRGYSVGPNMVISPTQKQIIGVMQVLNVAAECGVQITPTMSGMDMLRAIPHEMRALALLDAYSITLPARIYDDTGLLLTRMDYAWFLYAQTIPWIAELHGKEGLSWDLLQLAAKSATHWLWSECGRDGEPPRTATVENMMLTADSADPSVDAHMNWAEASLAFYNPNVKQSTIASWLLHRVIHRAFGALFKQAVVGPDPAVCACTTCKTNPHHANCKCHWCQTLSMSDRPIRVREDPISPTLTLRGSGIGTPSMLLTPGELVLIYSPDDAQRGLHRIKELLDTEKFQEAHEVCEQLRTNVDGAIETLTPVAMRTYTKDGERKTVSDILQHFENIRDRLVALRILIEEKFHAE